jgi:hypothetical protein
MELVSATPRPLYPRETPSIHCIVGWVGPRTGLDRCGKSRPTPGFDPRAVQRVASRYTDCAIPASCYILLTRSQFPQAASVSKQTNFPICPLHYGNHCQPDFLHKLIFLSSVYRNCVSNETSCKLHLLAVN